MTILLTRPAPQAEAFARLLHQQFGAELSILSSPLLRIHPLAPTIDLGDVARLIVTSPHAVHAAAPLIQSRAVPLACVGSKTTRAAEVAGFKVAETAPDAAHLLARLIAQGPAVGPCLYLRGQTVARPIVRHLTEAGIAARDLVVYRQIPQSLTTAARRVLDAGDRVILPLFSPRTAEIFNAETGSLTLASTSAVCLSPRIAAALEAARFQRVFVAAQPNAAALQQKIAAII